ncbi:MAG: hypothetical protein WAO83_23820 [Fuerstiella sp.]|jgi:hypothetical protein
MEQTFGVHAQDMTRAWTAIARIVINAIGSSPPIYAKRASIPRDVVNASESQD